MVVINVFRTANKEKIASEVPVASEGVHVQAGHLETHHLRVQQRLLTISVQLEDEHYLILLDYLYVCSGRELDCEVEWLDYLNVFSARDLDCEVGCLNPHYFFYGSYLWKKEWSTDLQKDSAW